MQQAVVLSYSKMQKISTKVFKCRICSKTLKSKQSLNRHQDTHNVSRPRVHSCRTCKKTFFHNFHLNKHVKNVHKKIKNYWCVFCEKQFCTKDSLDRHIIYHIGEKHFWCNMCDYEFSGKETLEIHHKQHNKKQHYKKYRCETCSKSFDYKRNLMRHLQTHNLSRPRPYVCTICNTDFITFNSLQKHSRVVHQKIQKYSCVFCEKQFGCLSSLNRHIIGHVGEKHFFCDICDKEFMRRNLLRDHKMLHTKQTLFKCSQCSKAFLSLASLQVHRLNHEPKSFQCIICRKMFASNKHLESHILKHIKEKPFFCSECDEEFKVQKALTLHLKSGQCCKKKWISSKPFSSKSKTSQTETSDGQDGEDVMDEDLVQEETENHVEVSIPNEGLPGDEESGTLPLNRAPPAVPEANSVRETNKLPEVRVCEVCGEQFSGEKLHKDYGIHIIANKHYLRKF
ncbi:unnamed protein product [Orchesella dallaii]|uniref:C2H2-type domain-containing protein n=1 Tax=Orchesella dallaii TaxID=48710 RepID=A0ABP1QYH8_9HEXA